MCRLRPPLTMPTNATSERCNSFQYKAHYLPSQCHQQGRCCQCHKDEDPGHALPPGVSGCSGRWLTGDCGKTIVTPSHQDVALQWQRVGIIQVKQKTKNAQSSIPYARATHLRQSRPSIQQGSASHPQALITKPSFHISQELYKHPQNGEVVLTGVHWHPSNRWYSGSISQSK